MSDRYVIFTAEVTTPDGSDTNAYGEPCEAGQGYTERYGWVDPSLPYSPHDVPDDVPTMRPGPDDDPAAWLVDVLDEHMDAPLTHVPERGDCTVMDMGERVDVYTGAGARLTAFVRGFTDVEVARAMWIIRSRRPGYSLEW